MCLDFSDLMGCGPRYRVTIGVGVPNAMQRKVVATDLRDMNSFGTVVTYGSLSTTGLREYFIYPFDSIVSDFGGTLGLFVGFSFVMLWDVVPFFITLGCQKMK